VIINYYSEQDAFQRNPVLSRSVLETGLSKYICEAKNKRKKKAMHTILLKNVTKQVWDISIFCRTKRGSPMGS
jgi:hypothetical protein